MILLDRPYVSDFLLESVRQNQIPLIAQASTRDMYPDVTLPWISEASAREKIMAQSHPRLITNSESSLAWLEQQVPDHPLLIQIRRFKNKVQFRELLR
ncbi:MAG: ATP-grasp domain-containing protein, partial [Bacteroidota bacterium]